MIDLKANPYYLSDEDCKWVEETIASMTPEEKVGQLFFQLTSSQEEEYLKELKEVGPDALIIADPGVFELAKEICPEIQRHVSTQANNTNYATYQSGGSRVQSVL